MEHQKNRVLTESLPVRPEEEDEEVSPPQVRLFATVKKQNIELLEYSKTFGDFVCTMISEGWLLSKLAELPGMPSVKTIFQWKRDKPEFKEALKLAYEARAEIMADKALEVADQSTWKTAKSDALKIETAKWTAEKSDPERFGNKKNEHGNTFNFFVNAGFNRPNETPIPIEIDRRDPSVVLGDKNEGNSQRVLPETASDRTETEGEKV